MTRFAGVALAIVLGASAAAAQPPSLAALETSAQLDPRDGGAEIELANAYWQAGETGRALTAYRRALALDNVMMETGRGDAIWSHEVAARVLARQPSLAAR